MPDAVRWERLVAGEEPPGPADRLSLIALSGASLLYAGATAAHAAFRALAPGARPAAPSLCVGNITLGGTGKTTAARAVARRLLERGHRTAVILRGYGRSGAMTQQVAHDGQALRATPDAVGDEAVMLGRSLERAIVLVGSDRVASARRAVTEFGADRLVLDDGLQHRRIRPHRTLALWDATQRPSRSRLFPRGWRRAPLRTLRRFDLVAMTRAEVAAEADAVWDELRSLRGALPLIRCAHRPVSVLGPEGASSSPQALAGRRVLAASSLGNPKALRLTLANLGAEVVGERVFPDHHLYTESDLRELLDAAARNGAERVVVTEKDMVKLAAFDGAQALSVLIVDLAVPDPEGEALLEGLLDSLAWTEGEGLGATHARG